MRFLLLLLPVFILANEYDEPADLYISYRYSQGLISPNTKSEHFGLSIGAEYRLIEDKALFLAMRYGYDEKTEDTYTFVGTPLEFERNGLRTTYLETGASLHVIENSWGYGSIEVLYRHTLTDDSGTSITRGDYFDGIITNAVINKYFTPSWGIGVYSGLDTQVGWRAGFQITTKF